MLILCLERSRTDSRVNFISAITPGHEPAALTSARTTCVLVDDHEAVRAGTRAHLSTVDWIEVIGEAGTVDEALEVIRRLRPTLVLMDMRIPGGDGMQAAKTLAAEGIDARVIIYSGHATTALAEQALDAGVAGFVLKHSPMTTVLEALRTARDGRRYLDPSIAVEFTTSSTSGTRMLSPREREVLRLVADGGQNGPIAYGLGISIETVKAHVSNILGKLDVDSRTEAVATAIRAGIID